MKKFGLVISVLALISIIFTVSCISKDYQVTETYSETEYKTEYKTESYTATEDVVTNASGRDTLIPKLQWHDERLPQGSIVKIPSSFLYLGYELPEYDTSKLEFAFYTPVDCTFDVYDVGQVGHITKFELSLGGRGISWNPAFSVWKDKVNSQLAVAKLISSTEGFGGHRGAFTVDITGVTELALIISSYQAVGSSLERWVEVDTQLVWTDKVTETKTVTKERQVPYEVPYQVEKQRVVTKTKKVPFWELIFGED